MLLHSEIHVRDIVSVFVRCNICFLNSFLNKWEPCFTPTQTHYDKNKYLKAICNLPFTKSCFFSLSLCLASLKRFQHFSFHSYRFWVDRTIFKNSKTLNISIRIKISRLRCLNFIIHHTTYWGNNLQFVIKLAHLVCTLIYL